ncbi:MAG TPA: TfoX/Sxy family protein [Anaerolineae bacterium]|nr:TfoX/Sxy family protein [Anaerolineae bacterium]
MAYDEGLAQRIRESLSELPGLAEKKMFGGVGYMIRGNMACGVHGDEMIVRVGPDSYEEALASTHTRPFDMTGRPMKGWVMVAPDGIESDAELDRWIQRGVEFALSLPQK